MAFAEELEDMLGALNNSPEVRNRRTRFEYLKQTGSLPPQFIFGIKNPKALNENLKKYVENFLRTTSDFEGTPIWINFERKGKLL